MKTNKRKTQTSSRKKANYINHEDFLKELIEHKKKVVENGGQKVQVSDKLAKFFIKIATNLTSYWKFKNYSYHDDFVSDSVENCLRYMHNFDPEKSSNPFSYFTQMIYFAFVRRIKTENTNLYVKYKSFLTSDLIENEEILTLIQKGDNLIEDKRAFVNKFEESLRKKKQEKKVVKKPIEEFIE